MIANRTNLTRLVRESVRRECAVVSFQYDDDEPVIIALIPFSDIDGENIFGLFDMSIEFHPHWDDFNAMTERLESGRAFSGHLVKLDRVPTGWDVVGTSNGGAV